MVYLFITKDKKVEHYANKLEAQKLFGYGEPDKIITEEEYNKAEGLFRLINGKIFLGKTDEEKKEELAIEKRVVRDKYLQQTDKYLLPDFPITKDDLVKIIEYRQTLRDIPQNKDFPDVDIPELTEVYNGK